MRDRPEAAPSPGRAQRITQGRHSPISSQRNNQPGWRGRALMSVTGMNHFTVLSDDLEATREFYVDFLGGLKVGWRPPFQFPGWWLYAGDTPILHVIHRDHLPEADRAGVLDHMAFSAEDRPGTVQTLD